MATWYLAKIRYQREDEAGSLKTINEAYLIDAVSYTDAEARVFEIVASNTPEFQITNLTKMKLSEVFFEDNNAETWFKAKVQYISFDEKSQKEKKTAHMMLINANDPGEVYTLLKKNLGNLNDYQITDINITTILEVCPYEPENEMLKKGNFRPVAEVLAEQEANQQS
ncbi:MULTISPECIES: DUF4494 domain-containing protein [Bacteroidota]|jgi:hypothetical protein|uniref:DUF4494 domain-containing protein n=2 Tax=Flectobacillus TaxID=101 RepID=A0ABT6Z4Y0_9BACT|nr:MULTISPECIES: DUF4494 domain-containing protein [Bacteroidota]MDI9865752.1 DUF4494 domain-containing protein [Flectobacillus longus]MDI9875636.1 DUF4494 domain-containing protein [Flectobacillus rivi]